MVEGKPSERREDCFPIVAFHIGRRPPSSINCSDRATSYVWWMEESQDARRARQFGIGVRSSEIVQVRERAIRPNAVARRVG